MRCNHIVRSDSHSDSAFKVSLGVLRDVLSSLFQNSPTLDKCSHGCLYLETRFHETNDCPLRDANEQSHENRCFGISQFCMNFFISVIIGIRFPKPRRQPRLLSSSFMTGIDCLLTCLQCNIDFFRIQRHNCFEYEEIGLSLSVSKVKVCFRGNFLNRIDVCIPEESQEQSFGLLKGFFKIYFANVSIFSLYLVSLKQKK